MAELKVSLGAHIESDIVVQIRFNLYFGLTDQKLDSNQPFLINQLINGWLMSKFCQLILTLFCNFWLFYWNLFWWVKCDVINWFKNLIKSLYECGKFQLIDNFWSNRLSLIETTSSLSEYRLRTVKFYLSQMDVKYQNKFDSMYSY